MKILSVEKAQKQFDNILINIQCDPVQIEDTGNAVLMSVEQFEINQRIKLQTKTSKLK